MIALRFLWMILSFLLVEVLIFLPFYLFGLCTFWAWYRWAPRRTTISMMTMETVERFTWAWLDELLGNREDGLCPRWWREDRKGAAYGWFVRNPVTNMRFWPVISTLPDAARVGFIGNLTRYPEASETGWWFCWQGGYAGVLYQGKTFGVWFGWKTKPSDKDGIRDYRWSGMGIACQFWKVVSLAP